MAALADHLLSQTASQASQSAQPWLSVATQIHSKTTRQDTCQTGKRHLRMALGQDYINQECACLTGCVLSGGGGQSPRLELTVCLVQAQAFADVTDGATLHRAALCRRRLQAMAIEPQPEPAAYVRSG